MTLHTNTPACSVLILCCQPLAEKCSESVLKAPPSQLAAHGPCLGPPKVITSSPKNTPKGHSGARSSSRLGYAAATLQGLQMTPPTLCAARRRRVRNNRAAGAHFLAACREPGLPSQGAGKLGSIWSDDGRSDSDLKCPPLRLRLSIAQLQFIIDRALGTACAWQTQGMMSGLVYGGSGSYPSGQNDRRQ